LKAAELFASCLANTHSILLAFKLVDTTFQSLLKAHGRVEGIVLKQKPILVFLLSFYEYIFPFFDIVLCHFILLIKLFLTLTAQSEKQV